MEGPAGAEVKLSEIGVCGPESPLAPQDQVKPQWDPAPTPLPLHPGVPKCTHTPSGAGGTSSMRTWRN